MFTFDDIIGQDSIIKELKEALVRQTISHAYIFEGPDGAGKSTLANVFCQAVVCEDNQHKPCGVCGACRRFEAGTHPDYKVIAPEKNTIGVDRIRELIDDIYINPYMADRKVYVIDQAQSMTVQAQNALLKTLENPPPYAVIILLTTSADNLLPTVVSRCLIYKLKPVSLHHIEDILICRFNVSADDAKKAAAASDGIVGKAISIANDTAWQALWQSALNNLQNLIRDRWNAFFAVEEFLVQYKDDIDVILDCWADYIRGRLLNMEVSDFTLFRWSSIMEYVDAARKALASNANYQLTVDVLLLNILEVVDDAHSSGSAF
ncbi:DNA polymerase III subunit delta' [Mahella australiensis]|nr:DNA polymerase III subunit delta' [Mahella australiensis]